jgi:hypothetical protein
LIEWKNFGCFASCPLGYEAKNKKCELKDKEEVFMNVAFTSMVTQYTDIKNSVTWTTATATAPQYSCTRGLYFDGTMLITSANYNLHSQHKFILWTKPFQVVASTDIVGCLYSKSDGNNL